MHGSIAVFRAFCHSWGLGSYIYFRDLERVIAFLGNAILYQVGFRPDGEISEHKDRMSFASDTVTCGGLNAFLRNA
jgi:hypothetical protein